MYDISIIRYSKLKCKQVNGIHRNILPQFNFFVAYFKNLSARKFAYLFFVHLPRVAYKILAYKKGTCPVGTDVPWTLQERH